MSFNEIEVALAAVAKGGFVVVADDAARENEGDLIIAAEKLDARGHVVHAAPHERGHLRGHHRRASR